MATPAINHARPAQFDRASQHRRAMIAKINIARNQLVMNEDDYRQGLFDATGRTSLKDCSEPQLERMLGWLGAKGFQAMPKKGSAQHPMAKKARALWISLYQLGAVRNPSEAALEAFAKRQLGCERLVWARQSDAFRLIEALKAMAERSGWRQTQVGTGKVLAPRELQSHLCQVILAKLKAAGAAPEDWSLDVAAWRLCGIDTGVTEGGYEAEHYARLADALGAKLRELTTQGEAA